MNNNVIDNNVTETVVSENTASAEQTNFMLKRMISDYLEKLKLPTMEEILKKVNEVDQPGELCTTHVKLLQCMVKDYYKATGKSIEVAAREQGITLKEGELSKLEEKCIDQLLADYCQSVKNSLS